ncbi:MAG TPA: glycosyltransferase family 4 protein [Terriglobia bacterium]|nr:glycosyltransferase family 4 protein [Terriglobia bacterium]
MLERAGARRVMLFLDTGIGEQFLPAEVLQRVPGPQIALLWAGRLQPRKCLPLLLEALMQCKDLPLRLLVAGKGAMRGEWETLSQRLGLCNRVEFLGQVGYDQMPALYRSADVFIFTSLRDAFGSQVLEAMASGLPIIALDHQGVGAFVPDSAGVKVPIAGPPDTVSSLGAAIRLLATSPEARDRMGLAAWEFARTQTWHRRAELMTHWYEEIVQDRSNTFTLSEPGARQS